MITGCRTQGRFGNGQGQEYAEEYMIEYWRPGFVKWVRWKNRLGKEVSEINFDEISIQMQNLFFKVYQRSLAIADISALGTFLNNNSNNKNRLI